MSTWWRVVAGLAAGGADLFANGTNWKQVLVSVGLAAMGIISHATSTSDPKAIDGVKKAN
jgi:hypothetical protein